MSKKILIVVTDLNPGGVTTALANWAELLFKKGHKVELLNMSRHRKDSSFLRQEIKRIHLRGLAQYWQMSMQDIRAERKPLKQIGLSVLGLLKKLTNKRGTWYRLVFSTMRRLKGYDAVLAFRQCAPCYYVSLHCVEANKKIGFIHGERAYMGDISSWDKYFSGFDAIACVADYVRGEFAREYPACTDKFHCVYNVFDIEGILKKSTETPSVTFSETTVNLVTVARIDDASKNICYIPQVCRKLVDKGIQNFHWYIVGDGPDKGKNERLTHELGMSEHITFTGHLDNPYPLMKAADLSVVTSSNEAYSMTVKEAHVLGVPVLSTNYATAHEAIEHETNGYLVDLSVDGVVQGLIHLLQAGAENLRTLKNKSQKYQVINEPSYLQLCKLLDIGVS